MQPQEMVEENSARAERAVESGPSSQTFRSIEGLPIPLRQPSTRRNPISQTHLVTCELFSAIASIHHTLLTPR